MSENPYAIPSPRVKVMPSLPRHPGQGSPFGGYREVGVLSKVIVAFLGVGVLFDVVYGFITMIDLQEVSQHNDDQGSPFYLQLSRVSDLVDHGEKVLMLVLAVLWCIWTSRVCKNAWLINSQDGATAIYRGRKSYKPVEAWIFHFIPIIQFWIPFQAMAWIRDASQKPLGLTMGKLVGLFWFFWFASSVAAVIRVFFIYGTKTNEEFATLYRVSLVLSPLSMVSAVIAGLMVLRLSLIQRLRASDLGLR
ncbi:MAG: hypothetical protein ACJA16_005518 [Akkermansiaceae bacterium]|jgi:hypothetical protein